MISNQIIQTSIDELKAITKIDLCVFDTFGENVASTTNADELDKNLIISFCNSPADSQVIGNRHLLKVHDDGEIAYILLAIGSEDEAYMIGKIAVSQLQNLIIAYKERFDRNSFFQNLLLDNLLLVDIHNRAQKLHVKTSIPRIVYLVETAPKKDTFSTELLREIFSEQGGDYITSVDEEHIILIKAIDKKDTTGKLTEIANTIVDMLNTEAMTKVRVSYGTVVDELKDVSKSYKEAKMAMDVGKIFYEEKNVASYQALGVGRLIYQLPVNLCKLFIDEIFGDDVPQELDEETMSMLNKFFENNLNVSETSRKLFLHRNTLVYRLEKIQKITGLDLRNFDDALTFKIALMVVNYMKYLSEQQ